MGHTLGGVALILMCESKFFFAKALDFTSACPYKNSGHTVEFKKFFCVISRRPHTKQKKRIVQKPPYSRGECIVEPYNATGSLFQYLVKIVSVICARA